MYGHGSKIATISIFWFELVQLRGSVHCFTRKLSSFLLHRCSQLLICHIAVSWMLICWYKLIWITSVLIMLQNIAQHCIPIICGFFVGNEIFFSHQIRVYLLFQIKPIRAITGAVVMTDIQIPDLFFRSDIDPKK